MDRRERFFTALKHKQPDRPPMDFCGTSLTAFADAATLYALAKRLGVKGDTHEQVLEGVQTALHVDFRSVGTIFNPESPLNSFGASEQTDCWGVKRKWTGDYWDIVGSPLKDATMEDLDNYTFPSAKNIDKKQLQAIKTKAKRLFEETDFVVVGEHPTYGVLELGCWMCGFDDFLYRILAEPEFVEKFFSKVYQYQAELIELYYGEIGQYIHLTTSGDDFGTQRAPFMSPKAFSGVVAPWYKKRIALTKQYTNAAYFHHSCGSVFRLLDSIIDMGVDILNPVQPGAFEMEPERLKAKYGEQIVFWGAIDEQNTLTNGTPEEVRAHVKEVVSILGKNGGYVIAPSHNIQKDVPIDNIIAMFEANE